MTERLNWIVIGEQSVKPIGAVIRTWVETPRFESFEAAERYRLECAKREPQFRFFVARITSGEIQRVAIGAVGATCPVGPVGVGAMGPLPEPESGAVGANGPCGCSGLFR